jgi:hypothetical protein
LERHPGDAALQSACQIAAFEYFRTYLSLHALHGSLPFRKRMEKLFQALRDPFWAEIIQEALQQSLSWKHRIFCQCCRHKRAFLSFVLFMAGTAAK